MPSAAPALTSGAPCQNWHQGGRQNGPHRRGVRRARSAAHPQRPASQNCRRPARANARLQVRVLSSRSSALRGRVARRCIHEVQEVLHGRSHAHTSPPSPALELARLLRFTIRFDGRTRGNRVRAAVKTDRESKHARELQRVLRPFRSAHARGGEPKSPGPTD